MSKCNCIMEYCPKCHPSSEESKPGFNEVFPPKSPTPAVGKAEELEDVLSKAMDEIDDNTPMSNNNSDTAGNVYGVLRRVYEFGRSQSVSPISAEEIESAADHVTKDDDTCCGESKFEGFIEGARYMQSLQGNAGVDNGDTARLEWVRRSQLISFQNQYVCSLSFLVLTLRKPQHGYASIIQTLETQDLLIYFAKAVVTRFFILLKRSLKIMILLNPKNVYPIILGLLYGESEPATLGKNKPTASTARSAFLR